MVVASASLCATPAACLRRFDWGQSMTPNAEQLAFYWAVGKAIAQWSFVEKNLRELVAVCVEDADREAIVTTYLSIENFRSKLQFVDRLFAAKFGKTEHRAPWERLYARLRTHSGRRNILAHSVATAYKNGAPGRRIGFQPWLLKSQPGTPTANRQVTGKPPNDAVCLRDVEGMRLEFLALATSLANFHNEVFLGMPAPPPTTHGPPSGPPTIRSLEIQMREALGLPPKPSRPKRQKEKNQP